MIKINNNYSKIIQHSNDIRNLISTLQQKRLYLKHTYGEIINQNTTIDVITTDSFAFQNNIFELKIQNNLNIYDKISCHLYGDYYRLIRRITNYIHEYIKVTEYNILDDTILNSVKLIDKLEPYKLTNNSTIYNITSAEQINNYIIDLLEILNKNYKKLDEYILTREKSLNEGLNIENYIENIRYNNENLKNNIKLYNYFLNKYQTYHIKYLSFLQSDIQNLYENINSEINFNNINFTKEEFLESVDGSNNVVIEKKLTNIEKYKCIIKKVINSIFFYTKLLIKINFIIVGFIVTFLYI